MLLATWPRPRAHASFHVWVLCHPEAAGALLGLTCAICEHPLQTVTLEVSDLCIERCLRPEGRFLWGLGNVCWVVTAPVFKAQPQLALTTCRALC